MRTLQDFYVSLGTVGDWSLRRKIEKAVMEKYVVSWKDELSDEVFQAIIDANKKEN